jgi:hypothetical protein
MKKNSETKLLSDFLRLKSVAALGVCSNQYLWLNTRVPADRVIPLCQLMGWEVTPHELRPDLHPTPISGIPEGVILPKKPEGV